MMRIAYFILRTAAFVVSITTMLPASARAALISLDDPKHGVGALTLDTASGLEWLDLTKSIGRSYDDLVGTDGSNEFVAGGDFEGFRYASVQEVMQFWSDAGIVFGNNPANYAPILALLNLIGVTRDEPGCCGGFQNAEPFHLIGAFGKTGDASGVGHHFMGDLTTLAFDIAPDTGVAQFFSLEDPNNLGGNYLVRPAVPEPATLTLTIIGACGIALRSARRRRRGLCRTSGGRRSQPPRWVVSSCITR